MLSIVHATCTSPTVTETQPGECETRKTVRICCGHLLTVCPDIAGSVTRGLSGGMGERIGVSAWISACRGHRTCFLGHVRAEFSMERRSGGLEQAWALLEMTWRMSWPCE